MEDEKNATSIQVVLLKGCSLRELNAVCLELNLYQSLTVRFVSDSIFGFWHLFQALSSPQSIGKVYAKALSTASPHMVIGAKPDVRKNNNRRIVPPHPYWVFSLKSTTPLSAPLVICVDETLAHGVAIPPFWIRRTLISVETKAASLIALNAFVSTLGGGHYLCKHVSDAWSMAIRQQAIALALGDMELAGQCRIHLAYISMQVGKLKSASKRLESERKFALKIESNRLLAVVYAAEVYLNKLTLRAAELKRKPQERLRDEFYRQRFVNFKKSAEELIK